MSLPILCELAREPYAGEVCEVSALCRAADAPVRQVWARAWGVLSVPAPVGLLTRRRHSARQVAPCPRVAARRLQDVVGADSAARIEGHHRIHGTWGRLNGADEGEARPHERNYCRGH